MALGERNVATVKSPLKAENLDNLNVFLFNQILSNTYKDIKL